MGPNKVVPFLSEKNIQWVLGFEVGLLYALMQTGAYEIEGMYHRDNEEQLFVIASNLGYSVEWSPVDRQLSQMKFTNKQTVE